MLHIRSGNVCTWQETYRVLAGEDERVHNGIPSLGRLLTLESAFHQILGARRAFSVCLVHHLPVK